MEKKTGRENKATKNKQKIIDAAIKLIGEKGVEGTSLAHIAKEVGISKGTLYYYYATKNDLIFDITEAHMGIITGRIFSLIEKNKGAVSWKEMLKILFTTLLKSKTRTRLHLYLIQEVLAGNEILKDRFSNTYLQWFKMVEDGYGMMASRQGDISIQARIFVSVIDGFIIQAIIGAGEIPVEDIIEKISKMIE